MNTDFLDLLDEFGIEYRRHGESRHVTPGFVGLMCPFCDEGVGNFGLGYSLRTGGLTCWKCGRHSPVEVLAALGVPMREAIDRCKGMRPVGYAIRQDRPTGILAPPNDVHPLSGPFYRYVESRGLDPEYLDTRYGVLGIGRLGGVYKWRLFIPVTQGGRVVSWTTRAIGKGVEPRYLAAPDARTIFPLKNLVYGLDDVKHTAIVCEGVPSVWRLGPGAVATFGAAYTPAQVMALGRIPRRVVCLDTDVKRRCCKLADELDQFPGETIRVTLESAKDPSEVCEGELNQLREYLR